MVSAGHMSERGNAGQWWAKQHNGTLTLIDLMWDARTFRFKVNGTLLDRFSTIYG